MDFIRRHVWLITTAVTLFVCLLFAVVFYPREPSLEAKLESVEGRYRALKLTHAGREALQAGRIEPAVKRFDQALRLGDDLFYTNFLAGTARFAKGDLEEAIARFDRVIALAPEYEDAYNSRGVARYYLGDLEGALEDFDAAIERNPEFLHAHINRAVARFEAGDPDGALADARMVIDNVEGPKNAPLAYAVRGLALARQGKLEPAEADFTAVAENAEDSDVIANALHNRAQVRRARGNAAGAERDLARAVELRKQREEGPSIWADLPEELEGAEPKG